ncbi:MAG: tRNA (N6-threonylcarbamoyladenosine(37)-N6)-methyltransferase TrmO [Bacillota bacterium]|nr:tRNA (N6-threonylcarbamoyladenosine(37)-N6)-methyltransferase TrmO [Bacillota bacterium]
MITLPCAARYPTEVVIDPEYNNCLDGIEGFSHLLVLYWAHLVSHEGRLLLKVHPMERKDLPLTGIFATCSPARPNPICAIVVRLLKREGDILKVQGFDAVDGSPILDLKPYNPGYYPIDEIRVADWIEQIYRERKGEI